MLRNLFTVFAAAVFVTAPAHAEPLSLSCSSADGRGFNVYLDMFKQEARYRGLPVDFKAEPEKVLLSTNEKDAITLVTIRRKDLSFKWWRLTSKPAGVSEFKGQCVKMKTHPGYQL